jgi:hypothetical protein
MGSLACPPMQHDDPEHESMTSTADRELRAARAQPWRDLAALLDPAGRCTDPLTEGRELDWHRIYAVAAAQMVAPTLYPVLAASAHRWRAVPGEVQQALAELHRLNEARNARLRSVLRDTVKHLNAAGTEPLLLKGSIALLPGQYAHAGARMLGDLDLALQSARAEEGAAILLAAGYRELNEASDPLMWDRMHHLVPLLHPSGNAHVELHREVLGEPVPAQALPLAAMRKAAQPVEWDGLRLWAPSLPHRLLHNALHDAIQDHSFRTGFRSLRQILEFARLRELPAAAALDWPGLLESLDRLDLGEALRAQLLVCRQLFNQALPEGVRPGRVAERSADRYWMWIERPGLWPVYQRARRVRGLIRSALTPSWYPSKWRHLRKAWQTAV